MGKNKSMSKKTIISKEKFIDIKNELKNLVQNERPKIIAALQSAREQGDLSENADYDAAKQRQGEIEAKIKDYENIINNCEVIGGTTTKNDEKIVKIGSSVEILDMQENEKYVYSIVGTIETDPDNNKISNDSPLAAAILGKKVGDIVEIKGIERPYKVKILKSFKN